MSCSMLGILSELRSLEPPSGECDLRVHVRHCSFTHYHSALSAIDVQTIYFVMGHAPRNLSILAYMCVVAVVPVYTRYPH